MNRFFLSVSLGIMLILVWPVHGTSVHDNYVYFKDIHGFDFHMKDYCISHGQPFTGWYSGYNDHGGYICVHAGRHGTSHVADWFNDRADVAVGDRVEHDDRPGALNFAIYGDMILKGQNGVHIKCKDIVIGQGHVPGTTFNNWWFGGKSHYMKRVEKDDHVWVWLECPPVDGYCAGTVTVETVHDNSNTFKLPVRACPSSASDPQEYPRHR